MTKEIVNTAIRDMPQEFNLDELFQRLIFIENVEVGLKEIEEGKTIPLAEVKKIMEGWRK